MTLEYKTKCKMLLCHQELLGFALKRVYVCLSLWSQSLQLVETCRTSQMLIHVVSVEPEA